MTQSAFVHLHNHSEGSYADSALTVTAMVNQAADWGMPAVAITDHGEMGMTLRFAREAARRGLQPILGVEFYFVADAAETIRARRNERHHLVLLAQNLAGFRNLITLSTASWEKNCFMQKVGLIDWTLLEAHREGLICLTGCLAGPLASPWVKDDPATARVNARKLHDLFGDRLYVEVFDHHQEPERKAVAGLTTLAAEIGRPLVLTNDCHYLRPEDWVAQDTILKTRFGKATDFELATREYYFKSEAEMRALALPPSAVAVTLEITERITLRPEELVAVHPAPGRESWAILGRRPCLTWQTAVKKATAVLKVARQEQERAHKLSREELAGSLPEAARLAERIEGLPEKNQPDFDRAVRFHPEAAPPLARAETLLYTMWNEEDCRAWGAEVLEIAAAPALAARAGIVKTYQEGLHHFRRRKLDKARHLFAAALVADPDYVNARYQLALTHYYRGAHDEARREMQEVLARQPYFERLPHLRSFLGWCLLKTDQPAAALVEFDQSLAEKTIPGSLAGKGFALAALGRDEEARATLLKYVKEAPDDAMVNQAQEKLDELMRSGAAGA